MATESSTQKNQPGLYRHPETGAEQVIDHDPVTGSAMADAFVRVGYIYVGEKADKPETKKEGTK